MANEASGVSATPEVTQATSQADMLTSDSQTTNAAPQAGENGPERAETEQPVRFEDLKKLRSENQNLRKRLKEVDDAQLSELERAKRSAEEAETKAKTTQQRLVKYEVADAARKLGVVNPDLVYKLIKDDIELDDDGMPINAEASIRAVLKDNPYLANPQQISGSATNPARGQSQSATPVFSRAQFSDLDFFEKNKIAMLQALKEGRVIN